MLKEAHAVLPAADLERARAFYRKTLNLDPDEVVAGNLVYHPSPGIGFEIYETANAGTAKNTQMLWMTDDLDAEMTRLRGLGIEFEDFDVPGTKTVDGVATTGDIRAAWFRDTEGNILCIAERL